VREEPAGRTKRLYIEDPERLADVLVTYRKSFVDDAVDRFADAWLGLGPRESKAPPPPAPSPAPATPPPPSQDVEFKEKP
jgi:hypothetical protein